MRALARARVARGIASRIRYETVRRVLKKELTPWRRVQRGDPPVSPEADFVIRREAVRDRYSRPYDARYPVIGRDEHAQRLRADQWPSPPARPGRPATYDYEYVRCGPCTIGMFVEPLGQWRTAVDWAHPVKALVAPPPRDREAERRIRRVRLVFTPRHGSWLHRAEPELSVLTRQTLFPRRATQDAVHAQVTAWVEARHAAPKGIDWQFRTADARVRLKHLYPAIET